MTDPHPVNEDPEDHIGEPVPDPWELPEPPVTSGPGPTGGEAEVSDGSNAG